MKVSHKWLQAYFEKPIPEPKALAELFISRSFEIESVEDVRDENGEVFDSVLDAKILPDRAHYCLSHKGVAGEIYLLTKQALKKSEIPDCSAFSIEKKPPIIIEDCNFCRRYVVRYVENITVGDSPDWTKKFLEAIGQRSIFSIVDATNICMFDVGQPLHAFDADKINGGIVIRLAKAGEKITLLDGVEIVLTADDHVIADDLGALAIAGVKGGKRAEVGPETKNIIIESANFDPVAVRRTSTRHNIRSESSKRFENEITAELAHVGMNNACALVKEMNQKAKFGPIVDEYPVKAKKVVIKLDYSYVEERLGLKVPFDEAVNILERMGISVNKSGMENHLLKLAIPFERLDLVIPEDIVEEIGRVYGYERIQGVLPSKAGKSPISPTYYLTEKIRDILASQGFSEVSLYSVVSKGDIEVAKPLAEDKAFARENLMDGMMACLDKNALNADLLGLKAIKIFEIGRVFSKKGERLSLSMGVAGFKKSKEEDKSEYIIAKALESLPFKSKTLDKSYGNRTVLEIDLDEVLKSYEIPEDASYEDLDFAKIPVNRYKKFSQYPFIVRDIAVFVPDSVSADHVWQSIEKSVIKSGDRELLKRNALFDIFKKGEKNSYAFRLIFQSMERTMTDKEANKIMENIYETMREQEWEVR